MRFLFSIPLPLLLILITFDSFDTKAAPYDQSAIQSSQESTTDIRFANSSYANKRDARLIRLDKFRQAEDDVKPMALGSEGDSSGTETAENYDDLSFDELEKKKNTAEEKHKKLKEEVANAKAELEKKETDAKGPLEEYDNKKKAYEDLKEKADGMNKDLKNAEAEFEAARTQSITANGTFDELQNVKNNLEAAEKWLSAVKGAKDRKPLAEGELLALNQECTPLKGTDAALEGEVTSTNGTLQTKQDDVNLQQELYDKCKPGCSKKLTYLNSLIVARNSAKENFDNAVKKLARCKACPNELKTLEGEVNDLTAILLDAEAESKAVTARDNLKIESELPKYDKAVENQVSASANFLQKQSAKDEAVKNAPFTPDDIKKAQREVKSALFEWKELEKDHDTLVEGLAGLKRALQDLEKKFANDEGVVDALQQIYEKKLSEKKPNQGSATLIAVCAVVGVLLAVGGIAAFLFILKRRKAAKKDAEKPVDSKAPSDSADSSATPAQTASAPPPEPPVSAKKESGSDQSAPK